ncbi:MAG: mechanosensitive ion channel domain-containing protein, partial [Pseudomonadota bacterium]
LLVDGSVVLLALPPALLLFGSDWSDVIAMVSDALLGFQIGSVRISILQIFLAVGLFGLLIAATRFIQRTAQKRLFPRTRMDLGVQNSLTTLIGYVGLLIAFMTAVGILGFDLSNLAIIAGALSVGIGFGLQSIVNNFVSGLILLFERPIKVGDWIVTGSGEGIVKRISVRSTEIETFDRSSIIIPNSELISGSVTNWTHKNKLGRVTVTVGVSYNEDPDKIMDILRGIPNQIDIVLNYPEPLILFTGFGDSSLDFEIRAFLADVGDSLKARTRIRVAIFKAFREAGVEIPFPQRDLHIRTGGVPSPDEG